MAFSLYTDGGCYPNPGGPGGSAWIIEQDGRFLTQGVERHDSTTNNRAELTAVIRGLEAIPEGAVVDLQADSQYVTKGLSEWRYAWRRGGWKGVANEDLWRRLDELADRRVVTATWVRGHAGHPQNEACDRLASQAYRGGTPPR